ncbi:CHASE domain-containing protein [Halarcobacter sp.]|uniref:CHASE domain-containing protein n=1 Tax=Halarcobacter sp. TaxID=2321133 RepID=UPI0029F58EF8|nr:CHASE domain-containing protein [Halarcobacter sp.]
MIKNRYKLHVSSIIIVGFLLSLFISFTINNIEEKAIKNRFENVVDNKMKSFYREISVNLETLYTLSILFNENKVPSRETFQKEALKIINRHNALQALEWIPRVPHDKRQEYEKEFFFTTQDKNKKMIQIEKKDEYFPVYYVVPLENNEEALGFDLSSNRTRDITIQNSLLTKQPRITKAIELVQNKNKKGFLAFLPIFKNHTQEIRGFVLGVFVIEDIFTKSMLKDNLVKQINFNIYDISNKIEEIIFSHKAENKIYKHMVYKKTFPSVWGKQWTFEAIPSVTYINERKSLAFELSLIIGILITIIISYRINKFHNQKFESIQQLKNKDEILYIQSRYATIGETLSNIEHQWRSPLSKLSSNIISIQSEIEFKGMPKKEKLQTSLENMQKTLDYMSNIVDEFKNFHIQDKTKTNFMFDDTLNVALKLLENDFTKLNIQIIRQRENDLSLYGYQNEFAQVLINILSNSRDVFIERQIKKPLIQIQTYKKDRKIFIKIRDNAQGIEKKHINNIFEQFYSTKQSSGIGLHLCMMIINKHMDGEIKVENTTFNVFKERYKGAAFTIILPIT